MKYEFRIHHNSSQISFITGFQLKTNGFWNYVCNMNNIVKLLNNFK